jgi:hypothetical protein
MCKSRFTDEQFVAILRERDSASVAEDAKKQAKARRAIAVPL